MNLTFRAFAVIATVALAAAFASCKDPGENSEQKSVVVAGQSGLLKAGEAGEVTFAITTSNIADNTAGRVSWFTDETGNTAGTTPAGISVAEFRTASNSATLTINGASNTALGTYYFKVTIDGATSGIATLTVDPGLDAPANLRAENVLDDMATLRWDAVEEAESYLVRFQNTTYPVDGLSHNLTRLTEETEYTWEVASVKGEIQSGWAKSTFTTIKGDGRTRFIYVEGKWNEENTYDPNMENFTLMFLSFDSSESEPTGVLLNLDMLFKPSDVDTSLPIVDLPKGTFPFVAQNQYQGQNAVLRTNVTTLETIESGVSTKQTISDGTLTIDGDHTGYNITVDVMYGSKILQAKYSGPISIVGTPEPQVYVMGDMTFADNLVNYYKDPYGDGNEVDAWICQAQSGSVVRSGAGFSGTGFFIDKMQFIDPNGAERPVPNGTHYIGDIIRPGYVLAGYHDVDYQGTSHYRGMWVYIVTNGQFVRYPIVGGTVESEYANGSYTMTINATDKYGSTYRGTVKGTGRGTAR
jgi:hypothetical protein